MVNRYSDTEMTKISRAEFKRGKQETLKEELKFYELLESSDDKDIEMLFSKRIAKIKKEYEK